MALLGDDPSQGLAYYPLNTIPRSLDIVWCQFPTAEMPSRPGPKTRPALVNSVAISKNNRFAKVKISYGTSQLKEHERPYDLIISNYSEMHEAGLPQATRFDLDQTIWLPWCAEFFAPRTGFSSPIIGRLPQSAIAQLQALIVHRRAIAAQSRP